VLWIQAARSIPVGAEITIDYGPDAGVIIAHNPQTIPALCA
jgi:hypothetical protein